MLVAALAAPPLSILAALRRRISGALLAALLAPVLAPVAGVARPVVVAALAAALADGVPLELRAEELKSAARALARVTGAYDVEDVLDVVFSDFCVGK